jgi:hypothetical protein
MKLNAGFHLEPIYIYKMCIEKWDDVMWTGLVWLRIGTGGELL